MYYSIIMGYKNNSSRALLDISRCYFRDKHDYNESDSTLLNFFLYNVARAHEMGYYIGEKEIHGLTINAQTIRSSGYYLNKMPHE